MDSTPFTDDLFDAESALRQQTNTLLTRNITLKALPNASVRQDPFLDEDFNAETALKGVKPRTSMHNARKPCSTTKPKDLKNKSQKSKKKHTNNKFKEPVLVFKRPLIVSSEASCNFEDVAADETKPLLNCSIPGGWTKVSIIGLFFKELSPMSPLETITTDGDKTCITISRQAMKALNSLSSLTSSPAFLLHFHDQSLTFHGESVGSSLFSVLYELKEDLIVCLHAPAASHLQFAVLKKLLVLVNSGDSWDERLISHEAKSALLQIHTRQK